MNLTGRAAALVPAIRFVPDNIVNMAGEGIAWMTKNVRVDPVVFKVAMTRITTPAVESQAGKEIGFTSMFPGAGSNDTVSKDPL